MIDDITYAQKDKEPMKETPLGYNIYRDNKKINDLPVETCTYTDETATVGKHIYKVTAVYGVGESYFSNEAEIDNVATGINTAKSRAQASRSSEADSWLTVLTKVPYLYTVLTEHS